MTKVFLNGCCGRMGRAISAMALENEGLRVRSVKWVMLKYYEASWLQKNGKVKTKVGEWRNLISDLCLTIDKRLMDLGYDDMDIDVILDEAKKKGIKIDLKKLSELLKVPVVGIVAKKKKTLNILLDKIIQISEKEKKSTSDEFINKIMNNELTDDFIVDIVNKSAKICNQVCKYEKNNYSNFDRKVDKILTSKITGIPIMILFLGIIFWVTIVGSNYPSKVLFTFFDFFQKKLLYFFEYIHSPVWLKNLLVLGIYQTVTWIISVMLPPMAIFFPLFTLMNTNLL